MNRPTGIQVCWLLCVAVGVVKIASAAPVPATNVPPAKAQPLVLSGAQPIGNPLDSVSAAVISPWKPLFRGIDIAEGSTQKPRHLKMVAVRVDLQADGIDFLVTPSNGDDPKDVDARTTSEFLAEFKCQAAINGSVFDVFAKTNGQPMDIHGLSKSRGDEYSPANEWDALLISSNREAWIARSPIDAGTAYNGLSGFFACLYQGTNCGTMKDRHPRTIAGVSRDNRYLILMVLDGRQPGYSEGATTAEAAEWTRRLGAFSALNLDGGGSTAMAVQTANGAKLVNRPCGPPPGTERRVGNHLGIFAVPLAD